MDQMTPVLSHLFSASGAGPEERGRLDETLARVGELYQALQAGRNDVDCTSVLSQLHVDLALHFALEEADEYFGAVQRERPSLSHGITELRREHAMMLEELDGLRELAKDGDHTEELGTAILRLVTDFRSHERKETDLLQESVLRDDGIGPD
jgi:hypothetical protein